MTFIASVVARDGVAIIADSLVTHSRSVIELSDLVNLVKQKKSVSLDLKELVDLAKNKDSHTKDFEEKLFEYDKFTCITTAGNAEIDGKKIREIVEKKVNINKRNQNYKKFDINEKVLDFCDYIEKELRRHVKNKKRVSSTIFIVTHYDAKLKKTIIYKINSKDCNQNDLKDPNFKIIDPPLNPEPDIYKVVCDGQNRISETILFGGIDNIISVIQDTIQKLKADFNLTDTQISGKYIEETTQSLIPLIHEDIKMFKLSELSIQQAVDLASLLMKIEIDFQKYTTNIPTVGGVIKIATINKDGFKFISGHEIIRPHIY